MLHTFVALVQDKPGVLTRVASLFRRLNINIVSLTVGESERTDVSRFRVYGKSLIAQGGRYDNLYARFGTAAPAIGFTFTIEELD